MQCNDAAEKVKILPPICYQDSTAFLSSSASKNEGAGLFSNISGNSTAGGLFAFSKLSAPPHGLFGLPTQAPTGKSQQTIPLEEPKFEIESTEPYAIDLTTDNAYEHQPPSSQLWSHSNGESGKSTLFSNVSSHLPVSSNVKTGNFFTGFVKSENSSANKMASSSNLFTGFGKMSQIKPQPFATYNEPTESRSMNSQKQFSMGIDLSDKKEAQSVRFDRPHVPQKILPLSSYINKSSSVLSFARNGTKHERAATVQQRLAVLEAKDKAEHERRQAVSLPVHLRNGSSGVKHVTVGNCPDMCPETERYLREFRHRVSIFETHPGTGASWQMDHTCAVKDYSRSAADQAEPLPWELRPPQVLDRTMNYLLAAIADRPEKEGGGNLWKPWLVHLFAEIELFILTRRVLRGAHFALVSAECHQMQPKMYEFLWTRTRAIRKDITQQRLCSPTIVSIVEKITRFHIFCAARLVDQSMDAFDPRINSENLTQCLQTLKELYSDIQSSAGSNSMVKVCPCEAEFRAYMILMKLNECSVLE
ncbi:hypothetical protein ACTXT7_008606 [Hymenolepis weldensis]